MHLFTVDILFLSLLSLPYAQAWGSLGHRTVAYLASLYFTPQSTTFTNRLLNGQDISEAALFPDKVRHMPSFAYTAGWHYIDAQDDPPRLCGINITRDCLPKDGGCVVSAIANHTSRVADANLSRFYRGQSLRFMMHFFGDVHQPLHTENLSRGGNDLPVLFDNHATNLHSVWDTLIPNKHAGPDTLSQSQSQSDSHSSSPAYTTLKYDHDDEVLAAFRWAQRLYAQDTRSSSSTTTNDECLSDATDCSLSWASEANSYVCSYVLAHDVLHQELGGTYFEGAVPIIDDLIGKAGRRLAAWINAITDGIDGEPMNIDMSKDERESDLQPQHHVLELQRGA
ncbi:hypothetical protein RBB50_010178 [Rhinocladiella similis]